MTQINSYLTFNGNCREAMVFYQKSLGGELMLQTVGDSPLSSGMPERLKAYILQATLIKGELVILASDMVGEAGLVKGNAISLMLECDSAEEIQLFYENLSSGGQPTHPLAVASGGGLFGGLTDKFGNQWLLHFTSDSAG